MLSHVLEATDRKQEIKCLSCTELAFPFHVEIPCHLLRTIHRKLSPKRGLLQELRYHHPQPKSGLTTIFVQLKNGFYVCKSLVGKSKEETYFVTHGNYIKFKLHCS